MSSIAISAVSFACLFFWSTYLPFYADAVPVVIFATACGWWGIDLAKHNLSRNTHDTSRELAKIGLVACWLGLIANLGMFAVALIDLIEI
jgi:hypothetical protein